MCSFSVLRLTDTINFKTGSGFEFPVPFLYLSPKWYTCCGGLYHLDREYLVIPNLLSDRCGAGVGEEIMTKASDWKLLIATSDASEAQLLRHRLISEGIQCKVEEENQYPGVSHGGRTREIRVYVQVTEFESSQQVIEGGELGEDDE